MTQISIQIPTNGPIIDSITFNEYGEILIKAHLPDGTDVSRSGGLMVPESPYALIYNKDTKDWAVTNAITPVSSGYEIVKIC